MKLYIVRHGETGHNKKEILQGHHDVKLNKVGIDQAKKLALRLKTVKFDLVYSSDLLRAKKTTEEIIKFQSCPVKYLKSLRERNLGKFTNRPISELRKYIEDSSGAEDVNKRLPGKGESIVAMNNRVLNFLNKLYHKHKGQKVLLSTHYGVKKILLLYFHGRSYKDFDKIYKKFASCSLTIVKFHKENKYKIELENDIKHLLFK